MTLQNGALGVSEIRSGVEHGSHRDKLAQRVSAHIA